MMSSATVLEVSNVSKSFATGSSGLKLPFLTGERPVVRAVSGVSLTLGETDVLGLVGESGCGKSTLGRMVAGLIDMSSGELKLDGTLHHALSRSQRRYWARNVQMIFQNPYASLNPRQTVRQTIEEPLRVHGLVEKNALRDRTDDLLKKVGLDPDFGTRLPHELSGGQCQRVGIARALTVDPRVLICDEAVSALDVSIQAQILNLFSDIKERASIAYLFISHDLGVVERLSDRVAVMYLGRIVETAPKAELFSAPLHPYTQALLEAVPKIGRQRRSKSVISGERPSPLAPPAGCHFHPRCPYATPRCRAEVPLLKEVKTNHFAACHLND